jgi:hypothetical protein
MSKVSSPVRSANCLAACRFVGLGHDINVQTEHYWPDIAFWVPATNASDSVHLAQQLLDLARFFVTTPVSLSAGCNAFTKNVA